MSHLLISWFILSIAVYVAASVVPGIKLRDGTSAVVVAATFAILDVMLSWFLWVVLGIATLGIAWLLAFVTHFVVDAIVLKATDGVTDRLKIDGFMPAVWAAFVIAGVGNVGRWLLM